MTRPGAARANVSARNKFGETALSLARKQGNDAVVVLLKRARGKSGWEKINMHCTICDQTCYELSLDFGEEALKAEVSILRLISPTIWPHNNRCCGLRDSKTLKMLARGEG